MNTLQSREDDIFIGRYMKDVKLNLAWLLPHTRIRDKIAFAAYCVLITCLFQFSTFSLMDWDTARVVLMALMVAQFYLTAYIRLPLNNVYLRRGLLWVFHLANFVVFREVVLAFSPTYVTADRNFPVILGIFFLLIILGRDIRQYTALAVQLSNLEKWSARRILFEKPEEINIHLGEPGYQKLHPNEILYIRTRSSGDHTKVFGVKSRVDQKFREYETTAYKNFNEIGKLLIQFPQFRRISQSAVINYKYPFEERNGIVLIEGRRFTISKGYRQSG